MLKLNSQRFALAAAAAFALFSHTVIAKPSRNVDLVIALDVSGSMSGLIKSAKQRLWDIVNDFGQAKPEPALRVAIVTYGNPAYGTANGFVRIDQPFTTDLDAVNRTLFSFGTNGGTEYVARAVHKSIHDLQWSPQEDALKLVFVAGNERANQDPSISLEQVTHLALDKGVVVNAIYCGGAQDSDAAGWHRVAQLTRGRYASIDQHAAAVANVATPWDQQIAKLNAQLNSTYLAYGPKGKQRKDNQLAQDEQVAELSAPAEASRTVTKASTLYDNREWDLVDAVRTGTSLDAVAKEDLPVVMQDMNEQARADHVQAQARKRQDIQEKIAKLDRQRRSYIAEQREQAGSGEGLDSAMQQGLRDVARAAGFTFEAE